MTSTENLTHILKAKEIEWIKASQEAHAYATDIRATEQALSRAELLWGETDLSRKFRHLLNNRGVSIYDRAIEHHFTGSAIVLHAATRRVLMTFHPFYQIWQQLGGHDEGENHPVAISAREAYEESGIEDLWVCDWPVRIDPHPAHKCRSVPSPHQNWHYDICYMSVTASDKFVMSEESDDMRWYSIDEITQLVKEEKAQQRALEMAENSFLLFDALVELGKTPPGF